MNGRHDEDEPEPVYLLTQRRSSIPPPPSYERGASIPRSSGAQPTMAERNIQEQHTEERSARIPLHSDVSLREQALVSLRDQTFHDTPWDHDDDDDVVDEQADLRRARRFTRRQRATRVLGVLALAGALGGGTLLLEQPKARHEALTFVTLGHADAAERFGRRIADFVQRFRH